MPIIGQCGQCGHKFQAPDNLAGRRVKCPRCSAPVPIERAAGNVARPTATARKSSPAESSSLPPAHETSGWYIQTSDGKQHGPVSKAELDKLADAGRLDGFCRVRGEDSDSWRWAEDVYPQLTSSSNGGQADEGPPKRSKGDRRAVPPSPESGLVTCPDCGKAVSRRASQCPHCGCPAAILAQQGPSSEAAPVASSRAASGGRGWFFWLATAGGVATLVVAVLVSLLAWRTWRAGNRVINQVETLLGDQDEPPPVAAEPGGKPLSPKMLEAAVQEASAAMAKRIDGYYRQADLATSLFDQTQETGDLLEALAGGDLDAIPHAVPAEPSKSGAAAYQSKYDSLHQECLKYVRQNLPPEKSDRARVWEVAQRWADRKQATLGQQLDQQVEKLLGR